LVTCQLKYFHEHPRREQIRKEKPRQAPVLVLLREGNTQTIRIEPPQ